MNRFVVLLNVSSTLPVLLCFTHGIIGRREGRLVIAPGAWVRDRGFQRPVLEYKSGSTAIYLFILALTFWALLGLSLAYSFQAILIQPLTLNAIAGWMFVRKNSEAARQILSKRIGGIGTMFVTPSVYGTAILGCDLLMEILIGVYG